jgi:proteasome accessory factor B
METFSAGHNRSDTPRPGGSSNSPTYQYTSAERCLRSPPLGGILGRRYWGWSSVTDTSISKCLYCTPKLLRVAVSKVERLVNLVIALLSTRGYITADKIRSSVAGYSDNASDEAFSRMFERDKNELRDLGIPLETGKVSSFDPVEGYRINRETYALPAVELTADEAAAVAVATQLWESPELITATQGALLKLRAAGVDVDPDAPIAIASPAGSVGLRGSEDVLGALLSAIDSAQAVQFAHRPSRTEPYTVRTVEPWGVVTEKGRWYLVGHDRDRGATRTFRLSRIGGEVTPIGPVGAVTRPEDADLREIVADAVGEAPSGVRAQVWVADARATALRRAGTSLGPRQLGGRDGEVIELDVGTTDRLARDVAGYGADAVVLEPATLREEVLGRLRAHAGDGGVQTS